MKKVLAAAGIGAALTVGSLAGSGSASADSSYDNYRYLQGLNNNGIYVYNTAVILSQAHTICAMLDNGDTAYDAQRWAYYANGPLAWRGAYNQVGLAVRYFCPEHSVDVYAPDNY